MARMVPSTNVITRGGESQFHGTAWEFVRNDIFNANAFFRNATGQPKPNLKQNQFGVTLGGPVLRDKWFFFGSYQGTRQVNGLDPTSVATVILPPLTSDRSAAALAAAVLPGQSSADERRGCGPAGPALSDLCRREATGLREPEYRHDRSHQSGGPEHPANQAARWLLPDPGAPDDPPVRQQCRHGFLLLQLPVLLITRIIS